MCYGLDISLRQSILFGLLHDTEHKSLCKPLKVAEFSIQVLKGQPWALSIEYWLLSYGSQCINILAYEKFLTLELSTRFLFTCLLAYFSFHPIYSVHVFSFSQLCPGPPHISALQTPRSSPLFKKKRTETTNKNTPRNPHTNPPKLNKHKIRNCNIWAKGNKRKKFPNRAVFVCVCVSQLCPIVH